MDLEGLLDNNNNDKVSSVYNYNFALKDLSFTNQSSFDLDLAS